MMDNKRFEFVIYGKGGIGKSTISANLSRALAERGLKIMQIGCDPKHDSTRILMGGEKIPTVLDYLRSVRKEDAELSAVLKTGCAGIGCIEAGGPQPGVGCAGRGVISSFEFLKEQHAKDPYDMVLYDVLGDVVCGGFAVPIRREYADAVFLVTSGEYMSIYAANNILRGIRTYDGGKYRRVLGIIYNARNINDEDDKIRRFSEAVGLPVCAKVPRSPAFAESERLNRPVLDLEGYEREKAIFRSLAEMIENGPALYEAKPLEDDELERAVLGTEYFTVGSAARSDVSSSLSMNAGGQPAADDETTGQVPADASEAASDPEGTREAPSASGAAERPPLYGCAFNGACTQGVHLTDAIVIAHSPKACAFYTWQNISSPGRKNLFNRGILLPSSIAPNIECTDIGHSEAVFGGTDKVRETVRKAMARRPGAVVVITSCVSGIIGDDVVSLEEMSEPDLPVITVRADGDINGDYSEGMSMCLRRIAEGLIDRNVRPEGDCVNLINELGVSLNRETNYRTVKRLLEGLGISINCRFLGDATSDEVRHFLRAPLNILAEDRPDGRELRDWLVKEYGCRFMDSAVPVGPEQSEAWLRELAAFFHKEDRIEELIAREKALYEAAIERIRPVLSGKRVFLMTINVNIDWILSAAQDAGVEFVKIGVTNYLRTDVNITEHPERYNIDADMEWEHIPEEIDRLDPDLVISNYIPWARGHKKYLTDSLPMTVDVGFLSGASLMKRWADLFSRKKAGAWQDDRELYEKYNA